MGSAAKEWSSRFWVSEAAVSALLAWFDKQGRVLPWRETQDPYRIWVIETLLQQTRIVQAEARIARFLAWFPSLEALAQAPIEAVLEIWQGLGYYQRAHNLHRAAQRLHAQGGFEALWTRPDPLQALLDLPGIGPYTARAILTFSEKGAYLPVDGNLVRIFSRFFADPTPATDRAYYQGQADGLPPVWRQRKVAFALMDLATLLCTPRQPKCLLCPLSAFCEGLRQGAVMRFPVRGERSLRPKRYFLFKLHADAKAVWLVQRPNKGLWAGLWCLPMEELPTPAAEKPTFCHTLTHFQLVGYVERLPSPAEGSRPVEWSVLGQYGLPAPIKRLLLHEAEAYHRSL